VQLQEKRIAVESAEVDVMRAENELATAREGSGK
jgi:hypothetical protein